MAHWVDAPPRRSWVLSRAPRLTTAVVIALLVGAVVITVTLVRQKAQTDSFADPILSLCAEGGDTGAKLADAGLCGKAAVAKVDQVAAASAPQVTPDQVQDLVKSELAKRPTPQPVGPSSTQLAGAVQAFITANPTLFKAPAPTAEQIQAAVNTYMRLHPVQVPQPVPTYQMPGLGGFSGVPQYPPAPSWPHGRGFAPR